MYTSYSTLQRKQLCKQVYTDTQSTYLLVYAPGRHKALQAALQNQLHRKFRLVTQLEDELTPDVAGVLLVSEDVAVFQTIALVYPDLHTDDAVGCLRFGKTVIDIGTQGMQRHATFTIPFGTCDFDAVQTTGRHDLDTDCTQAHGVLHRTTHGTTEHDTFFQLLRNRIGDKLGMQLRLADFLDIDMNRYAHDLGQIRLQDFDIFTLLADNDTRTGAVNGKTCILCRLQDRRLCLAILRLQ